jgi:hypothetical protein
MNVSKAIELAMAETIRKYAQLGEDITIRAWQSLESDGSWKENPDRSFPMIDVRCSPPKTDDNESSQQVECAILFGTKTDDDKSHAFVSDMYEAGQGVCDKLFKQYRTGVFTDTEIAFFIKKVETEAGTDVFTFGGFSFGEGLSPSDESGVNMIGITMIVHFGRSDF